jgi:hypothetical protein
MIVLALAAMFTVVTIGISTASYGFLVATTIPLAGLLLYLSVRRPRSMRTDPILDLILNATPRRQVRATCGCWVPLECSKHGATQPVQPQPEILQSREQ